MIFRTISDEKQKRLYKKQATSGKSGHSLQYHY